MSKMPNKFKTLIFLLSVCSVPLWLNLATAEPPAPKDTQTNDAHSQAVRITQLLPALESKESIIREQAFTQLIDIGLPVVPFIVNHLKDKGVYVELTRRIMEKAGFAGDFIDRELKDMKSLPSFSLAKIDQQVVDKYFYGRYLDALRLCRQERYEDARALVKAILLLEGRLEVSDKLKLLLINCEERLIQKNIMAADLAPDKPNLIYEIGQPIGLTFRLQNISRYPIQISFGSNPAVFYIVMTVHSPVGDYNTLTRMQDVTLPDETLELKPGDKKEYRMNINTAEDLPGSLFYRTYAVYLSVRPNMMKSQSFQSSLDKEETLRQILTPEITARFFPPDVQPVLDNPMSKLEEALKGDEPLDIFLCALLVPDKDKEKAIKLIFNKLDTAKDGDVKLTLLNCLRHLTELPFELDEKTWRDWFTKYKK